MQDARRIMEHLYGMEEMATCADRLNSEYEPMIQGPIIFQCSLSFSNQEMTNTSTNDDM
jgi:hypothetical protein